MQMPTDVMFVVIDLKIENVRTVIEVNDQFLLLIRGMNVNGRRVERIVGEVLQGKLHQGLLVIQFRPNEIHRSIRGKNVEIIGGIVLFQTDRTIQMVGEEIVGVVEQMIRMDQREN